ncbi:unnamed protein product [Urochloa decumbens]|uniref:Uncharacterized protein n=1 Tax=Urochloa decumbens TaxID=240449 RepID=A0ABC8VC82_9POAL
MAPPPRRFQLPIFSGKSIPTLGLSPTSQNRTLTALSRRADAAAVTSMYDMLFHAAYDGDLRHFKRLVRALDKGRGRLREAVEAARLDGVGALHVAAVAGSLEVCSYMVEGLRVGVDPVDDEGKIAKLKSLGSEAVETKDYPSASEFYTKAMDLDPDDASLFSNRSLCWLRMGDGQKALLDARECRRMRPDWPKACYRQGAALMLLKDYGSACEALFDGFKLDPENADIEHALREAMKSLKISQGNEVK